MSHNDMNAQRNAWKPSGEIVAHCGQPVRANADFFVPPPAEIGKVISAESRLNQEDNPPSAAAIRTRGRVIAAIVAALSVGLVAMLFLNSSSKGRTLGASQIMMLVVMLALAGGIVGFIVARLHTGMRQRGLPACSYVGTDGIVWYRLNGCAEDGAEAEMLLFAEADTLTAGRTRHYYNGVYTGSTYNYNWRDANGETVMLDAGKFKEKNNPKTALHRYVFLQAAEMMWSEHRFDRMKAECDRDGFVQFVIDAKHAIRIGPGYVEFAWPGADHRVPVEEFADMSIQEGVFHFKHRDSSWLGSKGKFNFQYSQLPNATLFLEALDQLAGISFSGDTE